MILLDTSVLIDYYRKKDKSKSLFFQLERTHQKFAISVVTQFEIYKGVQSDRLPFWNNLFKDITILPFTSDIALLAANVDAELKRINKKLDLADLFIATTAIGNNLECATLNKKHFERIEKLHLIG